MIVSQSNKAAAQTIRAKGFEDIENELLRVSLLAQSTDMMASILLENTTDADFVKLSSHGAKCLDFLVGELSRQVEALEGKHSEFHNAACDVEMQGVAR